jgi:hypothetical protein
MAMDAGLLTANVIRSCTADVPREADNRNTNRSRLTFSRRTLAGFSELSVKMRAPRRRANKTYGRGCRATTPRPSSITSS